MSILDRVLEKTEDKIAGPVRWSVTFLLVSVLWLLFGLNSLEQWLQMIKNMFSFQNLTLSIELAGAFTIPEAGFLNYVLATVYVDAYAVYGLWMMIFVLISFGICLLTENNYRKMKQISAGNMIFAAIALVWGVLCLSTNSTFIYSGF